MTTLNEVRQELGKDEVDYPALALALGVRALPQLNALVIEDDPRIASKAAYLAGVIAAGDSYKVVAQAARSSHDVIRVAAAAAAAMLPTNHAAEITAHLLGDTDPGVRVRATKSAAIIDAPALTARVKSLGESDPEPHVRDLATHVAAKMRLKMTQMMPESDPDSSGGMPGDYMGAGAGGMPGGYMSASGSGMPEADMGAGAGGMSGGYMGASGGGMPEADMGAGAGEMPGGYVSPSGSGMPKADTGAGAGGMPGGYVSPSGSRKAVTIVGDKRRHCGIRPSQPRVFGPDVAPRRAALILVSGQKWVNGTTLHYWFFEGPEAQKQAVRKGFKVWENVGVGINFIEVANRDEAEVRVAFADDGSWSGIGRDILTFPKDEQTLNIGWDITSDVDTAVHEIGHTLGFPHEHQNPNAGIVWDEEAVYAALAQPPNSWDRDKTFFNIIRKIVPDTIQGSNWDPNSIMHYSFEPGLIREPARYRAGLQPAGGLSARDLEWVRTFYPPLTASDHNVLEPFEAVPLKIAAGQQANYIIEPKRTRYYEMRTFGPSDSVMVLFEEKNGEQQYLTGDDDSGTDKNAALRVRLRKGHKYILRVRVMYTEPEADSAIMLW